YERIGDHSVNIGVRVEYMVTGWLPEHTGAARLHARQERLDVDLAAELDRHPQAGEAKQAGVEAGGRPSAPGAGTAGTAGETDG
ncbi:MAG: hypothetical protein ACXWCB_05845, partial [Acidimicrobiales bacterium]